MSNLFKPVNLKTALAQASIHQKLRHYAVAKQLLAPFVSLYPNHVELQQRYRQLEQQQALQQTELSRHYSLHSPQHKTSKLHRLSQR